MRGKTAVAEMSPLFLIAQVWSMQRMKKKGRGFVGCHLTTMDNGKRKDEKGKMKEEKIMAAEMSPLFLMYNLVSFFLLNLHKLINTLIFFRIICTKLRFEGVFIRIFVLICTKIGIDSAKRTNKDFAGMKKKQ